MLLGASGCYTAPHAIHPAPARENTQVWAFFCMDALDNTQILHKHHCCTLLAEHVVAQGHIGCTCRHLLWGRRRAARGGAELSVHEPGGRGCQPSGKAADDPKLVLL